ncbi:MAG: DUF4431 domain-containing protein [Treponema sp.]|nr:DUF4431 domain-containing protein [Treponema sp.]
MKRIFIAFIFIFVVQVLFANPLLKYRGKVSLKKAYGPPNYGETPELDAVEYYYSLQLKKSLVLDVDGKKSKVKEIQLIFLTDDFCQKDLEGKSISLTGELEEANTGHHHESYYIVISDFSQVDF